MTGLIVISDVVVLVVEEEEEKERRGGPLGLAVPLRDIRLNRSNINYF